MMKKILFLLFTFLSVIVYAQKQGDTDVNITARDTLETESQFVYQDSIIPVLDISYHEYSVDGNTWTKDTTGANYVRFSNDLKNTWYQIPLAAFEVLWTDDGGVLEPNVDLLVEVDSFLANNYINSPLYKQSGDSLALDNLYTGNSGVVGYILTYNGSTAVWSPAPSGSGATSGRNVGIEGYGVFIDTLGSELQFANVASSDTFINVTMSDSTIYFSWDGTDRKILAGVGLSGGGALDADVTVNLYIPELTELTSVDDDADFVAIYDNDAGQHKKVHPQEFYPDIYVEDVLDDADASLFNFKAGEGMSVLGDGGGAVQFTANPIALAVNDTVKKERVDTINFVGLGSVTVSYEENGTVNISATSGLLPTCAEGEFLAYVGSEWTCVNVCDYICADTIINIINNYNDTVSNAIEPSGDIIINFDRTDCTDSTQLTADMFVKNTNNFTNLKIVTAPNVGELHWGDSTVVDGTIITVTQGDFSEEVWYISDDGTGSEYIATFDFQTLFSSNNDYSGTFAVNVSVSACVTESVCFGYLYNWYAVDDSREITSSDDWRVPDKFNDINPFINSFVGSSNGYKLRTIGFTYWTDSGDPTFDGTDEYGFAARGSGTRNFSGSFTSLSTSFALWSSFDAGSGNAFGFSLTHNSNSIPTANGSQKEGRSVRLVKDATGLADGVTTTYTGNDGKTYNAVVIDELYWTTENLEETLYRDLSSIPNVTDGTTWAGLSTGAWCVYDNDNNNKCK